MAGHDGQFGFQVSKTRYRIPTTSFAAVLNPLRDDTWSVGVIEPHEVLVGAKNLAEVSMSWQVAQKAEPQPLEIQRLFHIGRVAYLYERSIDPDDPHVMTLCISPFRTWMVDGYHRVAAAILRQDPFIELWVVAPGLTPDELSAKFPGIQLIDDEEASDQK